jgi:hypothetical protein
VFVAQDLDLDMARPLDQLLQIDGVVAEGVLGLAAGCAQRRHQVCGRAHHAHALCRRRRPMP